MHIARLRNHLLNPNQNPSNLSWMQSQFETHLASNQVDGAALKFYEEARRIYDESWGAQAIAELRQATNTLQKNNGIGNSVQVERISRIDSLEAMRLASPIMQRMIMACPLVAIEYDHGRIDGYGDTYSKSVPGHGVAMIDYLIATNGLMVEHEEKDTWVFRETVGDDVFRPNIFELADIQATWELAVACLNDTDKIDPTSVYQ